MKKNLFLFFFLTLSVVADENILLQRIIALENRVAELEEKLAPVLEEERVKNIVAQQKALARERMLLDAEYLKRIDLNLIEKAYQTGSKDWTTEEASRAFKLLIEKYPQANRTGCAVLGMAQAKRGKEQIELLEKAITEHGTCYFLNGVNVGAYARLYLGMRYKKEEKNEKAAKLFEEIKSRYPDAVDHKGQLLTSYIQGLE
ncbi:tetratricopeptide repeat protein [Pontiella agarivorans]|uniref:Tetratricopeptide repeat protein n=1 Tax=Pontiella agarivorans TaxID=3038953 RepID=A0ABU5MWQ5_9BACT|nr:tetratricopeptide repeat protein [Pontiella agarivorans]MDZ8118654.1 tetratricopeptide repeat protein [Pontiella agarivorans]